MKRWRASPLCPVFVHLAGPDAVPVAQDDSEPVQGQFPTSYWPVGRLIADSRSLTLRVPSEPDLQILVGLYRQSSMERLLVNADGVWQDHVVLATLEGLIGAVGD